MRRPWLIRSTVAASSASRSGWHSGRTWTPVPIFMRLVRAAIALARVSGAEHTERSGATWISASHIASSPNRSAASTCSNETANASSSLIPAVRWNSWNMPNSKLMVSSPCGSQRPYACSLGAFARQGESRSGERPAGSRRVSFLSCKLSTRLTTGCMLGGGCGLEESMAMAKSVPHILSLGAALAALSGGTDREGRAECLFQSWRRFAWPDRHNHDRRKGARPALLALFAFVAFVALLALLGPIVVLRA